MEDSEHWNYILSMLCSICSLVFKQTVLHTISIRIHVTGINAAVASNEKACAGWPFFPRSMLILASPLFSPRPFYSLVCVTTWNVQLYIFSELDKQGLFFRVIFDVWIVETEIQKANKKNDKFILFLNSYILVEICLWHLNSWVGRSKKTPMILNSSLLPLALHCKHSLLSRYNLYDKRLQDWIMTWCVWCYLLFQMKIYTGELWREQDSLGGIFSVSSI